MTSNGRNTRKATPKQIPAKNRKATVQQKRASKTGKNTKTPNKKSDNDVFKTLMKSHLLVPIGDWVDIQVKALVIPIITTITDYANLQNYTSKN